MTTHYIRFQAVKKIFALTILAVQCSTAMGATSSGATPDSKVALIQDGNSNWHVSLRLENTPPERLAAQEIVKYAEKISGVRLEVVKEPVASAKAIRIDCDNGRLDGFDLAVDSDRVSIHGHTPRGALYGAYQVLEDMGCRWYYIGELGEVVSKSENVSLAGGRSSQVASFPERSVMVAHASYYEKFDEWIDFLTNRASTTLSSTANPWNGGKPTVLNICPC